MVSALVLENTTVTSHTTSSSDAQTCFSRVLSGEPINRRPFFFFFYILSSVAYAFPLFEAGFFTYPSAFSNALSTGWTRKRLKLRCIVFFFCFWPPTHQNKVAFGFGFASYNQAATLRCYSLSNHFNYSAATWRVVTCMCIRPKWSPGFTNS